MSALDRLIAQAIGDGKTFGLSSDPLKRECPEVWSLMSRVHLPNHKIVTPAVVTLTLAPEGGMVKLVHRDLASQIMCSVPHLVDWHIALEAVLNSAHPPWTQWGRKEPKVRKRQSQD